jgi:peptidyl-prolyl cis-trans isomerase B (cyclophilin B)
MKNLLSLLALASFTFFVSCGGGDKTATENAEEPQTEEASSAQTSTATGETMVLIETDMGNIKAKLYDSTPEHRDNFIKLAKEGFYDGTLFHRVIDGFMIQGGDPDSKTAQPGQPLGMGGPGYTLPAEIGAKHYRGALSAARRGGPSNPEKRSSGSQFYIVQNGPIPQAQMTQMAQQLAAKGVQYSQAELDYYINYGGTPFLDGDYTVFGMVTEGLEVVDKIAKVQKGQGDRPVEDIKMKVSVIE